MVIGLMVATNSWAYNLPNILQLFGPVQGQGVLDWRSPTPNAWVHPGSSSSNQKTLLFGSYGGQRNEFDYVHLLFVWGPRSPYNCLRLVWWPTDYTQEPSELGRVCGYTMVDVYGPGVLCWSCAAPFGLDLTAQFNYLRSLHRDVYIMWEALDDGTSFYVNEVRLEMYIDDPPGASTNTTVVTQTDPRVDALIIQVNGLVAQLNVDGLDIDALLQILRNIKSVLP